MSLNYGSITELPTLPKNLIAKPVIKKPSKDDLTWLTWLITGINVGVTIISLGFSLPAQALIGAGLGTLTTAADTAISLKSTGKINPLTFGINLAATILPTTFAIRKIHKIKKLKELGYESVKVFDKKIKLMKINRPEIFKNFSTTYNADYISKLNPLAKKQDLNKLFKIVQLGKKISLKNSFNFLFAPKIVKYFEKKSVKLIGSKITINKYEEQLNSFINKNFKNLNEKDIHWIKSALISGIDSQKFDPLKIQRNLQFLAKGKTFLSPKGKSAIKAFIQKSEKKIAPFISGAINISKKATKEKWTLGKIIRYTGSRDFNDKVVQKVQWVDPNDLGRAPIEYAYQKLKKFINEAQEALIKKYSRLKKIAQVVEKANRINYNGLTVLGGEYLWSFRPLQITKPGFKKRIPCIMNFNVKETGKSKNPLTKNFGGKKSIIFWATRGELYKIWKEGTAYWYNPFNAKKGWWLSRGGRDSKVVTGISRNLALFLSFIPIASLRFINSMVSNLVENIHALSEGQYQKVWEEKFLGAFNRAIKNRVGRIISKNILGGFAKKLIAGRSGQYIEKIIWGAGTAVTNTLQNRGSLKQNIIKQSKAKYNTFGRIGVKRAKHSGKNAFFIQRHSNWRKMTIVRATGSAVVKGRIKVGNIKLN